MDRKKQNFLNRMTKIQELGAKRFGKKSTMAYMHRIQNEIQPIIGIRNIYRLPMDPETKKKWMDKSILMDFEIDSDSDSDSDSSKMTSSESSDESDSEFQSKSKSSIKKNDSTNQEAIVTKLPTDPATKASQDDNNDKKEEN